MAVKEKVIVFTLPPNTTHITQPLDKSCFSPLKSQWKKAIQAFIAQNQHCATRYDFNHLFLQAWVNSMTMKNVIAGFKKCGVYPFNRAAFVAPEEEYSTFKPTSLPEITRLNYIPMYSLARQRHAATNLILPSSSPIEQDQVHCGTIDSFVSDFPSDFSSPKRACTSNSALSASETPTRDPEMSMTQSSTQSQCSMPLQRASSLSHLLVTPTVPSKVQAKGIKPFRRVLTSIENIAHLERKEEEKKAALREKENH